MPVLLPIHIAAAGLGLVAGAVALSAAKGGRLHRASGKTFVFAMVAMCASAIVMAVVKGQAVNVIAGSMTAYLAVTALATVRPPSAWSRERDVALMLVALVLGLATFAAAFAPVAKLFGDPPFPFFLFGVLGLSGAVGDFRTIRSGPRRGGPRLSRHVWRMCMALWITTASFFSIRARVAAILPAPFVTAPLRILPVVLVLVAMLYWLWRLRFRRSSSDLRWSAGPAGQPRKMPVASGAPTY